MSSNACHGLQSNLEYQHVEQRIFTNKSTPPNSNILNSFPFHQKPTLYQNLSQDLNQEVFTENDKNSSSNCEKQVGGWNFIQELTHTSNNNITGTETDQVVYVHPLVKRSSSTLSMKSLEMCTESLGSETGSNISDNCDEFSITLLEKQNSPGLEGSKSRDFYRKVDRVVNFPPPLTSISCSDRVKVRPHREGGRLVLRAETVSFSNNRYFQAERVDGRLRLSFLKTDCEQNQCIDEDCEETTTGNRYANEIEEDYCVDAAEDDDADGEDHANGVSWEDNMKNNGCETEVSDFPRPSRCKEDGNGRKGMQIGRHFGSLFPEGYAFQLKV